MEIIKWICFILVCLDCAVGVVEKSSTIRNIGGIVGMLLGIVARVFVLYGTATCWLLR